MPEIQVADHVDVETLRARLRKMTDAELLRFGKDNRYMCSPYANLRKPPLEAFVVQLREARAEWRRRHPKSCLVAPCSTIAGRFVDLRQARNLIFSPNDGVPVAHRPDHLALPHP